MTIKWVKYKNYSGYLITGEPMTRDIFEDEASERGIGTHMQRALWLTSRLEAPQLGMVQSYDGAAMSGGLLHNIAVQPRGMEQGSLFGLLRAIADDSEGMLATGPLQAAFKAKGWVLAADGKLRTAQGSIVSGREIRDEFTPAGGAVPARGALAEQGARWARLFHDVLADERTLGPQVGYAARWMIAGNKQDELGVYRAHLPALGLDSWIGVRAEALPPEIDLAMSVYHAFSVNGPAPAAAALRKAMPRWNEPERFATTLIRALGTSTYGRWLDDPTDKKSRYDATRSHVWALQNWWPSALSRKLMPRNL